jgi:hypothetical protein
MDTLKKLFPYSFKKKKTVSELIVNILIYLVAGILVGAVIGICSKIPVINLVTGLAGALVELYVLVGIVLSVLDYMKILK